MLTWIHLSDLHQAHGSVTHRETQRIVESALIRDVEAQKQRLGVIDAIVFTGDISFSSAARDSSEYVQVEAFLLELQRATGASEIVCVPGNHDVSRAFDTDPETAKLLTKLKAEGGIDASLVNPAERAILERRFGKYVDFVRRNGWGLEQSDGIRDKMYGHRRLGDVIFVGVNTAFLAADEKLYGSDHAHLEVGAHQMRRALTALPQHQLAVALMHHPPRQGWLRDEVAFAAALRGVSRLHLSGHTHDAFVRELRDQHGQWVEVSAGASHEEAKASPQDYTHSYNIMRAVPDHDGWNWTFWSRRWTQQTGSFGDSPGTSPDGTTIRLERSPQAPPVANTHESLETYPRGPRVSGEVFAEFDLAGAIAEHHELRSKLIALLDASAARLHKVDPSHTVVKDQDVAAGTEAGPSTWANSAVLQAQNHGPRMVAALLLELRKRVMLSDEQKTGISGLLTRLQHWKR